MSRPNVDNLRLSRILGIIGILLVSAGVVTGFADVSLSSVITPGYYYSGTGLTYTLIDFFLGDNGTPTSTTINGNDVSVTPYFPPGTPTTCPTPLLTLWIAGPLSLSQLAAMGASNPPLPYYLLLDLRINASDCPPGYLLVLTFKVPSAVFEMWWWNETSSAWEKWPYQRTYFSGGSYYLEVNITDDIPLSGTPFAILGSRLEVGGVGEIGGGINILSIALVIAGIASIIASAALYYRNYKNNTKINPNTI